MTIDPARMTEALMEHLAAAMLKIMEPLQSRERSSIRDQIEKLQPLEIEGIGKALERLVDFMDAIDPVTPLPITLDVIRKLPEVKKGPDGEAMVETVDVNLAHLQIILLDKSGGVVVPGVPGNEDVVTYNFDIKGPGIDNLRVRKVILPTLDYSLNEPAVATVEMFVLEEVTKGE